MESGGHQGVQRGCLVDFMNRYVGAIYKDDPKAVPRMTQNTVGERMLGGKGCPLSGRTGSRVGCDIQHVVGGQVLDYRFHQLGP
jgi:hypothetical protein